MATRKKRNSLVSPWRKDGSLRCTRLGMAVILRGVAGLNWGFYSEDEQMMHLQEVGGERTRYKVWLEETGTRTFKPATEVPARILKTLQRVLDGGKRDAVEGSWTSLMIKKGWLQCVVDHNRGIATLTAYPRNAGARFTREVNLTKHTTFPSDYAPGNTKLDEETVCLVLCSASHTEERQMHIDLIPILWRG